MKRVVGILAVEADPGLHNSTPNRQRARWDTGRSTLRRSLAGLLNDELRLVARCRPTLGEPKPIDFTNFSLEPDGDGRLSDWMAAHLTVAVVVGAVRAGQEATLIAERRPPLNLQSWDNPWRQVVKAARARCTAEARDRYHA
jgi:hypothetical protein